MPILAMPLLRIKAYRINTVSEQAGPIPEAPTWRI